MIEGLSHEHQRTYDSVFQHPITSNLDRRQVRSMFEAIGDVTEEHNGNLKIDRNGHTLRLRPTHSNHPAGFEEVMQIRHFLKTSEREPSAADADRIHLLVVVDQRQVLIYRSQLRGSLPESVVPYDPRGVGWHAHDVPDLSGSPHRLATTAFYSMVAESLKGADEILMFGTRAGGRNFMDTLVEELKEKHPAIFERIVGALVVDEKHVPMDVLLAKARVFYHAHQDSEPARTVSSSETSEPTLI
jgi:hypothetical protein